MDFFMDNLEVFIPLIVVLFDLVAGKIPDKYIGYIGVVRRIVQKAREYKKNERR